MRLHRLHRPTLSLVLGATAILAQGPLAVHAAGTATWTGAGADTKWSTAANWASTHVPVAGDNVVFPSGVTNKTAVNDLAPDLSLGSLSVQDAGYSVSGAEVVLSDTNLQINWATLDLPIVVPAGHSLTIGSVHALLTALRGGGTVNMSGFLTVATSSSTFSGHIIEQGQTDTLVYQAQGRPDISGSGWVSAGGVVGNIDMSNGGYLVNWAPGPGGLTVAPLQVASMTLGLHTIWQVGFTPGGGDAAVAVEPGGSVSLGDALFGLAFCSPTAPGDTIIIVHHLGAGATNGQFHFIPEGSEFNSCGASYRITYVAGANHNDVVVTRLPPLVAVTGTDDSLWARQVSGFQPLGGRLRGAPAVLMRDTGFPYDSRLYLATGTDGNIWERGPDGGWQPATSGGEVNCVDGPAIAQPVSAGPGGPSALTIACQGTDGAVWYAPSATDSAPDLPTFRASDWRRLGGSVLAGPAMTYLPGESTPTFFALGTDHHVWISSTSGNFAQAPWTCIGHPSASTSGNLTYFACHGSDGALWYDTYDGTSKQWHGAQSLGGALIDGTAVVATRTGANFYVEGTDQAVWETAVTNGVQGPWQSDGGRVMFGVGASS